jgi:hypothetical protein
MVNTFGMKSRLIGVLIASTVLVSCGGEDLAVINLSGAANTSESSKMAAQDAILPGVEGGWSMYGPTSFAYEAGVTEWPELGGSQPSWRLKKHKATDADLIRIAEVFDVSGGISSFSYDKNSRFIGSEDYSKPTVTTYYDGISSSWNYSASTDITLSSRSEPSSGSSDPLTSTSPVEPPKPPKNVPTKSQATTLSEQFMSRLGVDTSELKVDVYADDWGASVTYNELIDGVPGLRYWLFTYGGEQQLQYASGPLSDVVRGPSYPTVSVEEAFKRLSDERFGVYPAEYMRANSAAMPKSSMSTDAAADEPSTDSSQTVEPEVMRFTLTGARRSVTGIYMEKYGNIMMPAYTFTSDAGDIVRVIAVADKYLSFAPVAVPEPLPPDSPPPVTEPVPQDSAPGTEEAIAISQSDADTLVGLLLEEAEKVASSRGWTLRVASVDGKENMLTTDYSYSRVNVSVIDGVVTAVTIG